MSKFKDESYVSGGGPFGGMEAGEVRSFIFRNGITKTITRTKRHFACDWHDASNEELEAKGLNFRWLTRDGGESFTLVDIRFAKHPSEKPWRPTAEEKADAEREVTEALERGLTMDEFKVWASRRNRAR